MRSEWIASDLGSLISTKKGYAFKSKWYSSEGRPLIKVSNFTTDSVNKEGLAFIPEEIAKDYLKYELFGREIIIQTVGSWSSNPKSVVGKVIKIPLELNHSLLNQNSVIIAPAGDKMINNFLYYLLKDNVFKGYIVGTAQGSASQASITLESIKNFNFYYPKSLETQQKIATILSNYDDLIENNEKRIVFLENMTKLIYEEWFVKFKFPRCGKVKMVYGGVEIKKIPENWNVVNLGNNFEVVLGGTPSRSKSEYWGGDIDWINSGKVNNLRIINCSEKITGEGLSKSSTKIMPTRSTVIAITGATLGQISLTEIDVCANQSVVGVYDPDRKYSEFIYLKIQEIINKIILKAGGGAQQHINKEIVKETEILLPEKKIINRFNQIIIPLFDNISNLLFKNENLKKTRDLLLPKLISGEIDVSELKIKLNQGTAI